MVLNQSKQGTRSRQDNWNLQRFKQKNIAAIRPGSSLSWAITITATFDNTVVYLAMSALEILISVCAVIPGIAALDTSPFPLPLSFCRSDEM